MCLLFCGLTSIMNAQQTIFTKVYYDLSGAAQAYSLVKTFDQNYLIAGEKDSQPMVMKVDQTGNVLWIKKIWGIYDFRFTCIAATHDSCFILAGVTPVSTGVENRIICVKITSDGDTLWTKEINLGVSFMVHSPSVQQTNDHGFILTGYLSHPVTFKSQIYVIKLDLTGNIIWSEFLSSGTWSDFAFTVKQTPDSGYILAGESENYPPLEQAACLIKLTSDGAFSWAKKQILPAQSYSSAWDVIITNTGIISYLSTSVNGLVLMKTDFSGNVLWSKALDTYPGSFWGDTSRPRIYPTSDGGYVFLSSMQGFDQLMKTDSTGNIRWGQTYFIIASDVVESYDSGYLVLGNGPIMGVNMAPTNNPQIGLIKTDSTGNTTDCVYQVTITSSACTVSLTPVIFTSTTGGLMTESHPSVSGAALSIFEGCIAITGNIAANNPEENAFRVSPNPSDGMIQLANQQPAGQPILKIDIFNTMGEKIYQSSNPVMDQSQVDLSAQPNGMYFIQALFRDKTCTQKILISH